MLSTIPIYEFADIVRIDIVFADGIIEQIVPRHQADSDDLQDRCDNLFRSEFEVGMIDCLIAYNADGDKLAVRTADEFFGENRGF